MSAAESAPPRVLRCVLPSPQFQPRIDRACDDRMPSGESGSAGHCSFGLLLIENRGHQVRWHGLEMGWLHRITRATFGKRTNRSRVTEQFGQRDLRVNNRKVAAHLNAVDAAAAAAQVATDVALKFFRRNVFNFHDRLEQNWFALLETVLRGEDRRHLERQLAGIDFVKTSINDIDLNIDNRITAEHTVEDGFVDALLYGGDVFA